MTTTETERATLFGMVMAMCQKIGMTENEALTMFHPENVNGGYAILNDRKAAK
jgi:hypothetical protein